MDFGVGKVAPLIVALLDNRDGIYVDALIASATYARNMFSSTLANFDANNPYYHELNVRKI